MAAVLTSRPQTGLSFLAPEPEDLEDLYSRYKVGGLSTVFTSIETGVQCVSPLCLTVKSNL